MAGQADKTRKALGALRLEMGSRLGLRNPDVFAPLWVVDFPLFEWDEETGRYYAMHHPFTSPKKEDIPLLETDPGAVHANAYDIVLNGNEIGGGSIRIHDNATQMMMFRHLGFTPNRRRTSSASFMNAFKYGAPPRRTGFRFRPFGGAFGRQRDNTRFHSSRRIIPGRDMMIDAPSPLAEDQLSELSIKTVL